MTLWAQADCRPRRAAIRHRPARTRSVHRNRVQQRAPAGTVRAVHALPAHRPAWFRSVGDRRLQGALLGAGEFLTGQRAKLLLLERVLDQIFGRCDVVVQTGPVPFDILGLPEIGFPIGFTAAGVPVGTILGGAPYDEDRLLAVVAAYQAVTGWHLRRPADPRAARSLAPAGDRGRLTAEDVAAQTQ